MNGNIEGFIWEDVCGMRLFGTKNLRWKMKLKS